MKGLYWFRHDLRVNDNPSLKKLNDSVSELLCVYVLPARCSSFEGESALNHQNGALSDHRFHFLLQSLQDLDKSLRKQGQKLYVLPAQAKVDTDSKRTSAPSSDINHNVAGLNKLIDDFDIQCVGSDWHCGFNEQRDWQTLQSLKPTLNFIQEQGGLLYKHTDFPFCLENMPDTFSPFRRKVEKYCEPNTQLTDKPDFAPKLDIDYPEFNFLDDNDAREEYTGGESAAHARLEEYFWQTDNISRYKETRNGLDGWDFSSRFSAWLAHGCISPKQILVGLKAYEAERTANDSTYWLFFELLWREFFHWQHAKHQALFFHKDGVQQKHIKSAHDTQKFAQWCNGETGYAIVDACMKQLKATGFMSNRGRQLVASCYIHELGLDWRYAAAYFEYQLIDFDLASNYGNWQYLAGVGADPRGLRQFNLQKQTQIYDPEHRFINKWK